MITVRPSAERGRSEHGWLSSAHTFSFSEYHDPRHMGFRTLRVINEDRVIGGKGFGSHAHRDMEIVTWVLDGGLEHRDSLGNGSVIRPGDVQRMSAGTGVVHSEWNASPTEPVHFLQIWILPEVTGIPPSYEERHVDDASLRNALRVVASRDGRDGSVRLHQDATLSVARLDEGQKLRAPLAPGRAAWLQLARGRLSVNGTPLAAGDGAALVGESELSLEAVDGAELLLFDLGA